MREEWKDIKGYEGLYQISSHGRVKSLDRVLKDKNNVAKRHKGMLFSLVRIKGYDTVSLTLKNKRKGLRTHRLVAQAFIPNPKKLAEVNHIDYNKTNNFKDNLEWTSKRENQTHGYLNKNRSSKYPGVSWDNSRKKWRATIKINSKLKYLGRYDCEELARFAYLKALKKYGITNKYAK